MLQRASTFAREHWSELAAVVCLGFVFGLGAWVGRHFAPEKVVEKEVTYGAVVVGEKHEQTHGTEQDTAKSHQVEHLRITRTNGTVIERTREGETLDHRKAAVEASAETKTVERVVYRDVVRTVESGRPSWRIGAMVGVDVHQLLAAPSWGGQVQLRVLGPVWVGAWGMSSGAGGLAAGVEF